MSAAGTLYQALTGSYYYDLAFAREPYSPDRQRRAIVAADSAGILQIWIWDLQLNAQLRVTNLSHGVAYDPVWSPDGNTIAYVSTETSGDELYLYNVSTRQTRRLTDSTGLGLPFNKHPSWSPDGQQLVFWSTRTGQPQIWIINKDGTGLSNISRNANDETDPIWVK
jgi:TolB protein